MASKSSSIKAAVIGAGRIGMNLELDPKRVKPATHFGMWLLHPKAELVAVCDPDKDKFETAKSLKPSIQTYTDAEKLLANVRPDIVSIATWRDTHVEMMDLAMDFEVPVIICEKPISENVSDAQKIVERAKKNGTHLIINHRRRFDPLLDDLRTEFSTHKYGEIIQVSAAYVYGLMTTGTHLIDTLRHLLIDTAGDVVWVRGFTNQFHCFAPGDDPCVDGVLGFKSGVRVNIHSLNIQDYDIFDFRFYGRKAMVHFHGIGRNIDIYSVKDSPEHDGFTELSEQPSDRRGGAPRDLFRHLADNAIGCLDSSETSRSTGEDSLQALRILLSMKQSAEQGGAQIDIDGLS